MRFKGVYMAVRVKRDLYRYKQYPYYEENSKKDRTAIQRVLRHYTKLYLKGVY